MTICISIPGQGRLNLGLMSVILSSQRFPLAKELKNTLIGPFEFVCYLHAIHSVKLTKIAGVESNRCNLVLTPPTKKCFLHPAVWVSFKFDNKRCILQVKHMTSLSTGSTFDVGSRDGMYLYV